jgi:inosose dehydratase
MLIAHHLMTWQGWANKQKQKLDLPAAFAEIRAAGYDGVELGGDAASCGPAAELRKHLADAGITCAAWSLGVTANPWPPSTEAFRKQVGYAGEMGMRIGVVCGGFLPGGRRTTNDGDYRLFAENLAAHADIAANAGVTLAFHPHRGCIVETAAEVDRLLRFIPTLQLCPDTGHLLACHDDPLWLLDAHPGRIRAMHLKDYDPATGNFAELGRGKVDLAAILAWMKRRNFAGPVIVERDDPPMPAAESARISWECLRSLGVGSPLQQAKA